MMDAPPPLPQGERHHQRRVSCKSFIVSSQVRLQKRQKREPLRPLSSQYRALPGNLPDLVLNLTIRQIIMETIRIDVKSPADDELLLFGVPFVKATFHEEDDLDLTLNEDPLPLWYTVRNHWGDGSIRWIFLHSRVPAGEHRLSLSVLRGKEREIELLEFADDTLRLNGCRFSVNEHGFLFETGSGSVEYGGDSIDSDLEAGPFRPLDWEITVPESSPLAPLIRIAEGDRGFSRDFLIRLDPVRERLILQRRMTVHEEGFYHLRRSTGALSFSGEIEGVRTTVLEPGKYQRNGEVAWGYPSGLFKGGEAGLFMEKFWQRHPAAVDSNEDEVTVEYYPRESQPLPVSGGMSYRHALRIACSRQGLEGLAEDTEVTFDPALLMETFACEKIYIPEGNFPEFEAINKKILYESKNDLYGDGRYPAELDDEEKQHPDFFGLEHYGDFPAPLPEYRREGKPVFYWDNEYDTGFGYYRGYAMSGDRRLLDKAYWHSAHMSDMDISSVTGDMKCHGTGHHHCNFVSEMGHVWNDGCWLNYFFFGDLWAKEEGERLCRRIIAEMCVSREQLIHGFCFAERYTGWPLMVLVAGYEALRDESILEGAKFLVDFMIDFFNDSHSFYEGENYFEGEPSEFYRSALMDGCKPFMLGIILESLERYYFNTGDERVVEPAKKACDFIIDRMWDFNRGAFIYEWNVYSKNIDQYNQFLACLFIRGFAFIYEQTGDRKYRDVATTGFFGCIPTLEIGEGAGGKNFAQLSRSLGGFVAYLDEWRRKDDQAYVDSCSRSSALTFNWEGSIPELMESGEILLQKGKPEYDGDALVSSVTSFIDGRFREPVSGDCGEVSLHVFALENNLPHARVPTINFKTYFHVSGDRYNESGLCVLTLYSRELVVRTFDENARVINVASAWIKDTEIGRTGRPADERILDWNFEEWHHVLLRWRSPGELALTLDGHLMDTIHLNRPLGGKVTRLCLGYRPGNWRLYGKVKLDYLRLGAVSET